MIDAVCPTCEKALRYPDSAVGLSVRCDCGQKFRIEAPSSPGGAPTVRVLAGPSGMLRDAGVVLIVLAVAALVGGLIFALGMPTPREKFVCGALAVAGAVLLYAQAAFAFGLWEIAQTLRSIRDRK
jgi:hypothetical protein